MLAQGIQEEEALQLELGGEAGSCGGCSDQKGLPRKHLCKIWHWQRVNQAPPQELEEGPSLPEEAACEGTEENK